jgi:hypothetical protein
MVLLIVSMYNILMISSIFSCYYFCLPSVFLLISLYRNLSVLWKIQNSFSSELTFSSISTLQYISIFFFINFCFFIYCLYPLHLFCHSFSNLLNHILVILVYVLLNIHNYWYKFSLRLYFRYAFHVLMYLFTIDLKMYSVYYQLSTNQMLTVYLLSYSQTWRSSEKSFKY